MDKTYIILVEGEESYSSLSLEEATNYYNYLTESYQLVDDNPNHWPTVVLIQSVVLKNNKEE